MGKLTRTHIGGAPDTETGALSGCCRKAKIAKIDLLAVLVTKDVLGLDVSMVDPKIVTMFHSIDELQVEFLDPASDPSVTGTTLYDEIKDVSSTTVVHHEVDVGLFFHDTVKCHNIGMGGDCTVKLNFPLLGRMLATAGHSPGQTLDSIMSFGSTIFSEVDDTTRATIKDSEELQSPIVDEGSDTSTFRFIHSESA